MWMSNILVMFNRNNHDRNSLADIVAAVTDTGASIVGVDADRSVLEVAAPAHLVPVIAAMEGVSYVRCVFNYLCGAPLPKAA
jgi:hypothetical protein